ncbi:MAG: hypothetical protein H5T73_01805 [Actinobacteria bacterium]|nr:hypothetical protein [Actinomycetota bacterium]
MKGSVGTTTSIYHTRLPHQWRLERMMGEVLSKEARRRLRWIEHFHHCGNARMTCRRAMLPFRQVLTVILPLSRCFAPRQ